MQHAKFETAVTILVGMGYPAKIKTVQEAYALRIGRNQEGTPRTRSPSRHAGRRFPVKSRLRRPAACLWPSPESTISWRPIRKASSLLVKRETLDAPHGGSGSDGGDEHE